MEVRVIGGSLVSGRREWCVQRHCAGGIEDVLVRGESVFTSRLSGCVMFFLDAVQATRELCE